ncbi:MAG: cobalamin biosynthesis protein [Methanopyri archaeon]|nr:cobalamin biosynthesis protein [Methanopyri archaeon]
MRREVDPEDLEAAFEWAIEEVGDLDAVVTLERKRGQPSGRTLESLASRYGVPVVYVDEPAPAPSRSRAEEFLGTEGSPAEGVLLALGYELIAPKRSFGNTVTAALGVKRC